MLRSKDKTVEMDNLDVCFKECKMPYEISLEDIENCWPKWQRFNKAFKIYLVATGYEKLSETRKAAMLLNCIGQTHLNQKTQTKPN